MGGGGTRRGRLLVATTALAAVVALQAAAAPQPGLKALKSIAVDLPADRAPFSGPGSDVLNANCLACHSSSMVLNQPSMTPAQWRATVAKMRDTYRAPLAAEDVDAIVAALAEATAAGTD